MVIINKSRLSNKRFREIIKFALPKGTPLPNLIFLKDTKGPFYGYYLIDKTTIRIGVGGFKNFPLKVTRSKFFQKKGYASGFFLRTKEEALIYMFSHEGRHHWQVNNPREPRKGKIKAKYSESDADLYALERLEKWRKKKLRKKMLK